MGERAATYMLADSSAKESTARLHPARSIHDLEGRAKVLHGNDTKTGSTTENRSRREIDSERIDVSQIALYLSFFGV